MVFLSVYLSLFSFLFFSLPSFSTSPLLRKKSPPPFLPQGLALPNPFVIGSGPPGTNRAVMRRAFLEGWGAVIAKTVSLDASKVVNVTPRYAKIKSRGTNELVSFENFELISDRPLSTMLDDFRALKDEFPDRVLIASIMEEYEEEKWLELVEKVEEVRERMIFFLFF